MIGVGLGVLRLSPDAFWRMTPRELALALRPMAGAPHPALGRSGLAELMARFPDAPAQTLRDGQHERERN